MTTERQLEGPGGNEGSSCDVDDADRSVGVRLDEGDCASQGPWMGVVAILDPRLRTKGYGRAFLDALPRCPVVDDRSAVAAFFGSAVRATA